MARTVLLREGDTEHRVVIRDDGHVEVAERIFEAVVTAPGVVRIGETDRRTAWTAVAGDVRWVFLDGETYRFETVTPGARRGKGGHAGSLMAPMPATVVRVQVAPGDVVKGGDTLIILEAMKMELPVRAPADGTVKAVHCRPGELVQPGIPLLDMEEGEHR